MRKTWTIATAGVGVAALALTGCGSQWAQTHNHNTPVGPYVEKPNVVIEAPYGFANVVRVCVDGDGVYTVHNGTSVEVIPGDPACKGK